MATHNVEKFDSVGIDPNQNPLECCDVCNSQDIVETQEGYVCANCGIVLEIQKLEYYRPYDRDIVQCAVLNKTQMGYRSERLNSKNSHRLEELSKLDSLRSSEESVTVLARVEIKRILTALGFPLTDVDPLMEKFKYNRTQLGKGTKYRSPQMLVPCIVYAYYKENNKPIREKDLLELTNISKKDFNAFKFSILRIWPEYQERNRKEYITQRILEVTEHFDLNMSFFYQSKRILNKFYDNIKGTKDDVIIGLVTSITLLCSQQKGVSISALCNRLDIKMSTIHRQVEKRVMQRFKISGFKSLVKSADLLKKVMTKLGVLDASLNDNEDNSKDMADHDDLIQVTLGNAKPIFNNLNTNDNYCLFTKGYNEILGMSIIDNNSNTNLNHILQTNELKSSNKIKKVDNKDKVMLELWRFSPPKGPPISC
ncbi:MAG: hypothetical protein EAX91_01785 [Candidatus Lokiarchaeota archaeon]|nr:hypothetical protein [Candidatus Lokiarchaeota archaeon]